MSSSENPTKSATTMGAARAAEPPQATDEELQLEAINVKLERIKSKHVHIGQSSSDSTAEYIMENKEARERGKKIEALEGVSPGTPDEDGIYVEFLPGDKTNPLNWPKARKWAITLACVAFSAETAMNCTAFNSGYESFNAEYPTSKTQWLLGNSMFFISIALTPLVVAPLSEVFGRNPLYIFANALILILFIPQALAKNIATIQACRWFQGMVSSVGNSMVGGTIADLFSAEDRGIVMGVFSLFIFVGQAFGSMAFGYVNMKIGFRWMFWLEVISIAGNLTAILVFCRETRGSVLLAKKAAKLQKETGLKHVAPGYKERENMATLITVSCVRPVHYLLSEPIVTAVSLWVGFCWGTVFLFTEAVPSVFSEIYGFNIGESGLVLGTIGIGAIFGFASNFYQERLYRQAALRNGGKAEPEARLYVGAVGAIIFPLSAIAFAWTGRAGVHWIAPCIFLTLAFFGIFTIYSAVFNYFADAYEKYSSSAQAAQSLLRNIFGGTFPLFTPIMYARLGTSVASTLVGAVAIFLAAAPFILLAYGKTLRAHSKVASALLKEAELEAEGARSRAMSRAASAAGTREPSLHRTESV